MGENDLGLTSVTGAGGGSRWSAGVIAECHMGFVRVPLPGGGTLAGADADGGDPGPAHYGVSTLLSTLLFPVQRLVASSESFAISALSARSIMNSNAFR